MTEILKSTPPQDSGEPQEIPDNWTRVPPKDLSIAEEASSPKGSRYSRKRHSRTKQKQETPDSNAVSIIASDAISKFIQTSGPPSSPEHAVPKKDGGSV